MEPSAPFPNHRTGVWCPMVSGSPNLVSPELSGLTLVSCKTPQTPRAASQNTAAGF